MKRSEASVQKVSHYKREYRLDEILSFLRVKQSRTLRNWVKNRVKTVYLTAALKWLVFRSLQCTNLIPIILNKGVGEAANNRTLDHLLL
ncbi:MAG: hypothetical protein D4R63_06900 [Methylococcaceae bacterium]|nr:MAG: hypothetical protein D4R63_06900 [Methylococcaceae bacterium]